MNPDPGGSVENEVAELRARIGRIEAALRVRGVALEDSAAPAPRSPAPARKPAAPQARDAVEVPVASAPPPPPPRPMFASSSAGPAEDARSLESRIGSQWFNRIGILAVLIGMAWFLKMAIDNHWIGPLGRVLIGLVAGAALIAWSERFRRGGYAAFSYSLKAIGSGTLYLSAVGGFLALPPAAFRSRVCSHDPGHRIQRIHGLGAGCGAAGALCHCGRPEHAAAGLHGRKPRSCPVQLSAAAGCRGARAGAAQAVVAAVVCGLCGHGVPVRCLGRGLLQRCAVRAHGILPHLLLPDLCLCAATGAREAGRRSTQFTAGMHWR